MNVPLLEAGARRLDRVERDTRLDGLISVLQGAVRRVVKPGRTDDALQTIRHFSEHRASPAYFKYIEAELWAEKQNYERAWKAWEAFHATQAAAR